MLIQSTLAFETGTQVKNAFRASMPILGVDVPPNVFDAMIRSSNWITDDEAWKPILSDFPTPHTSYAYQVREAVAKRKGDHQFLLLYALREERIQILTL